MNLTLRLAQVLLCLHTLVGAAWKVLNPGFANPDRILPSLRFVPHIGWVALGCLEFLLALGLLIPLLKRSVRALAVVSALCITAELLVFIGIHLYSGYPHYGQMIHWIVIALASAAFAGGEIRTTRLYRGVA